MSVVRPGFFGGNISESDEQKVLTMNQEHEAIKPWVVNQQLMIESFFSLLASFTFSPVGLILGIVYFRKAKEAHQDNAKKVCVAAIIVGSVVTFLWVVTLLFSLVLPVILRTS